MRLGVVIALMIGTTAQAQVPLPPSRPLNNAPASAPVPVPRPEEAGPPAPTRLRSSEPFGPSAPSGGTGDDEAACRRLLDSGKVEADRRPAVAGPEGCGIALPLTLRAIVMADTRRVAIEPPAVVRCDLAERLADWLRDDLAAPARQAGELLGLLAASGYACRSRNHVAGAQLSEHARGNAIDLLGFRFSSRVVGLKDVADAGFLDAVARTACARFSTVLGPGSDGYHEDNLHLDLENRKNGSHYCHWARQ